MTPTGVSYIRVVSQTDSDDTIEPFGGFTRQRVSTLILGVHLAHVLFNGHHVGGTRWSEGGSGGGGGVAASYTTAKDSIQVTVRRSGTLVPTLSCIQWRERKGRTCPRKSARGSHSDGPLSKLSVASTAKPMMHVFHLPSSFK